MMTRNTIMRITGIALVFVFVILLVGNTIIHPKPEDCAVIRITVTRIFEGGTKDIAFAKANGEFYYINRGLEQGMTLEGMRGKVLDKEVTLHLANVMFGQTRHIAQLALEDKVLYTEFD